MAKYLRLSILIFTVLIFAAACGTGAGTGEEATEKPEIKLGELEYADVNVNSQEFDKLYSDAEFADWYEDNYKQEGVSSFNAADARYLLVSAGEKKTGGYSIDNIVVTGNENNIEVKAKLHIPAKGSLVTQSVTYPNVLLKLPGDERKVVFKGFEEVQEEAKEEMLIDTGRYVGQIDPHSVEIKISGVPEDQASKAFQLDASIQENFEQTFGLQSGDQVKVTYFMDEYGRQILTKIEKL